VTLPLSGPMSASMINVELGRAGTAPFDINGTPERTLAGVPSGTIKFSDFYGKSASSVNLLLHMDALVLTNQVQDYSTYAGNLTLGPQVGVVISTSTFKFGPGSLFGPGGNLANTDMGSVSAGISPFPRFDMTVQTWTWEFWFNESDATSLRSLICQRNNFTIGWVITTEGIRAQINGAWTENALTWGRPSFGAWHYIAVQREGATLTAYIDGNRVATRSDISSFTAASGVPVFLGTAFNSGTENAFKGFIDEVRFTKNKTVYPGSPATITPPSAPFPNS